MVHEILWVVVCDNGDDGENIATDEEVRDEASNKSPTKFSSPFPCSFSLFLLYFPHYFLRKIAEKILQYFL